MLRGGYEKYINVLLAHELYHSTNGQILNEISIFKRESVDFLGVINQKRIAIEMGLNALSKARQVGREGVIHHMIEDTTKVFTRRAADEVYTIGIVDSMTICQSPTHLDIMRKAYRDRFPIPIDPEKRANQLKLVVENKEYFGNPALNKVRHISFTTVLFSGYQMELHFFICGPFTQPIKKWW